MLGQKMYFLFSIHFCTPGNIYNQCTHTKTSPSLTIRAIVRIDPYFHGKKLPHHFRGSMIEYFYFTSLLVKKEKHSCTFTCGILQVHFFFTTAWPKVVMRFTGTYCGSR